MIQLGIIKLIALANWISNLCWSLVVLLINLNAKLFSILMNKVIGTKVIALLFTCYLVLTAFVVIAVQHYRIVPKDVWATTKTVTKVAYMTKEEGWW